MPLQDDISTALAALRLDRPEGAPTRLAAYLELLKQYSRQFNLTGFSSDSELVDEIVVESLRLLSLGELPDGAMVVDLGSGSGSPVVPLALLTPGAAFTAVESRGRRADFLELVRARVQVPNLAVRQMRVEDLAREGERWDVVTSRAYAPVQVLLPQAAALLKDGGEVRGYVGAETDELLEAAQGAGLAVESLEAYDGPAGKRHVYRLQRVLPQRAQRTL